MKAQKRYVTAAGRCQTASNLMDYIKKTPEQAYLIQNITR